jgi:hypothetical protein
MMEFLRHFFQNSSSYFTIAATLALALGSAASIGAKLFGELLTRKDRVVSRGRSIALDSAPSSVKENAVVVARRQVVVRLNEVRVARDAQEGSARVARISNNALTVAQYVIGGVLASSFVQESLTPKWVGFLGVLVLIASLVKQQFHPELNAEDARKKALRLKALIRISEDELAVIGAKMASGDDHSDAMIALLNRITQQLNEIENPATSDSKP